MWAEPLEIEVVAFKVAPGHEGHWFSLVALCSLKRGAQEGKWLDPSMMSKADFLKDHGARDLKVLAKKGLK